MPLSHDGYAFQSGISGSVEPYSPEVPMVIGKSFGVLGESHLIGSPYGRDLNCELTISGYASDAACQAAIADIHNRIGTLTGTLTNTVLGVASSYPNSTFLQCYVSDGPRRDGSGVHGWFARLRLTWRQRASV